MATGGYLVKRPSSRQSVKDMWLKWPVCFLLYFVTQMILFIKDFVSKVVLHVYCM
jgi:hypothetical protein